MVTRTDLKYLTEARELIADPARWCQGDYAQTRDGRPVSYWNLSKIRNGVRFCALGALAYAGHKLTIESRLDEWLDNIAIDLFGIDVISLNDTRTHQDILTLFDKAIEIAEFEVENA